MYDESIVVMLVLKSIRDVVDRFRSRQRGTSRLWGPTVATPLREYLKSLAQRVQQSPLDLRVRRLINRQTRAPCSVTSHTHVAS